MVANERVKDSEELVWCSEGAKKYRLIESARSVLVVTNVHKGG